MTVTRRDHVDETRADVVPRGPKVAQLSGRVCAGDERTRMGGMVTGELRRQIDAVWNDFWSGGISNPLEVMEQLTYLLFVKALDEQQTLAENKANRTGQPIPPEDDIFPAGQEFRPEGRAQGRPYGEMRWSRFKHLPAAEMYDVVGNYVFAFLQQRAAHSSHAQHMAGARFTIPTPALLQKAVDGLDAVPMADRDTKGDVYEYMLSKIATAGQNGQFRTPRHIIELMVEMTAPQPDDVICDPASGTCGFLVGAGEHIRRRHPGALTDPTRAEHFHNGMFSGFDFDSTMLRIGSMNMQLHGVQNPNIAYRDSLAEDHADDAEAYSLILANPPFAGSLDYESTAKDLLQVVRTKKTEASRYCACISIRSLGAVTKIGAVQLASGSDPASARPLSSREVCEWM